MIETKAGLPNTCHDCGAPQTDTWFAASVDAAIAGGGICAACQAKRAGVVVTVSDALEFTTTPELAAALLGEPDSEPPVAAATPPPDKPPRSKRGKA